MDSDTTTVNNILEFFTELFNKGASFSAINTAKSALATFLITVDDVNWTNNFKIVKFLKGVFKLRTPLPKYSATWDVDRLLKFIISFYDTNDILDLKDLTLKTITLIAITSGSRAQALHKMNLDLCTKNDNQFTFVFNSPLKTSTPKNNNQVLEIIKYNDEKLCPYRSLESYIKKTNSIRQDACLWISFHKPHKKVGKQSISRWIKLLLKKAGIDTEIFTAHSTRSASCSKASQQGVGLDTILKTANWANSATFAKYYKKNVIQEKETFGQAVLRL